MIYGYVRVSTANQKIDRQLEEIKALGVIDKNIFIDKESGKDFNQTNYKKLINKLKENDLLIIKSIDRLGRNYKMIIEQWSRITKNIKANIKVIDMPLLDTSIEIKNLIGTFISDVVLQVLSFVAENERVNIKERQREGIRIAKSKGVVFGSPKISLNAKNKETINSYVNKKITTNEAIKELNISRGTFFRLLQEYKKIM
ncbi:MAG: recombinase family protein [Candidatus Caccosoma sp.]|nr:recombinase family protein [Candidatus Caccosoma sp.]